MYLKLLQSCNRLHPRAWDFIQLTRLDKPIGIYLLLWPTLSALWIAAGGAHQDHPGGEDEQVAGARHAAYSWGILMCFTATRGTLPPEAWLLFIANVVWTVAYDTYYAMADREDDLKIGIRSTAILFGDADRAIILTLQGLMLFCLVLAGVRFELGQLFHLGLVVAAACYAWEFYYTRSRNRQKCFAAFLHNHWAGLAIFAGVVADLAQKAS